jgi:S-adenosylmethionine hydrolase
MRQRPPVNEPPTARPIVTLTTDFGVSDAYVAQMKAQIIRQCPHVRLIDVTHHVPPQDILCGSILLERAIDGFPPGTVHLAVVDPGVGTDRRIIVAEVDDQSVVCPDNGLITWAWRLHRGWKVHEVTWRPHAGSTTFHGRDIMGPIAGRMASARDGLKTFSREIDDPILLDLAPAPDDATRGTIIHLDHFGNATTNIRQEAVRDRIALNICVGRKSIGKLRRTYWDVAPGRPLALIGSSGLLEIAVRDGSARDDLKLHVGDEVILR